MGEGNTPPPHHHLSLDSDRGALSRARNQHRYPGGEPGVNRWPHHRQGTQHLAGGEKTVSTHSL